MAYWIYGSVDILIGDDYEGKHTLVEAEETLASFSNTAQDTLAEVEKRYEEDPDSVNVQERKTYLSNKFQKFLEEGYKGPTQARVLTFMKYGTSPRTKTLTTVFLKLKRLPACWHFKILARSL